ncbi:MAG: thioredoxin family protein [Gemmatimonadaceae bacterium]
MKTLHDYFAGGSTFAGMASASAEFGPLFTAQRERALVPDDLVARAEALPGDWHLLVISEDWCIDSQSTTPVLAAFADRAANLDLRIVGRDANLELMDAHLTNGKSRSIPVVILLDADYQERAWWGPRPSPVQRLATTDWKDMEKPARNREIRRWYAMDKGRTILEEIVGLAEQAAAAQPASASAGS